MVAPRIDIPPDRLAELCRRWKIRELSLFGSVLREDFGPDSDVDVLISLAPEAGWSLLDHAAMAEELSNMLGRRADVVTRAAVESSPNRIRRQAILESAQRVYAA